jgi:hypothetical protein
MLLRRHALWPVAATLFSAFYAFAAHPRTLEDLHRALPLIFLCSFLASLVAALSLLRVAFCSVPTPVSGFGVSDCFWGRLGAQRRRVLPLVGGNDVGGDKRKWEEKRRPEQREGQSSFRSCVDSFDSSDAIVGCLSLAIVVLAVLGGGFDSQPESPGFYVLSFVAFLTVAIFVSLSLIRLCVRLAGTRRVVLGALVVFLAVLVEMWRRDNIGRAEFYRGLGEQSYRPELYDSESCPDGAADPGMALLDVLPPRMTNFFASLQCPNIDPFAQWDELSGVVSARASSSCSPSEELLLRILPFTSGGVPFLDPKTVIEDSVLLRYVADHERRRNLLPGEKLLVNDSNSILVQCGSDTDLVTLLIRVENTRTSRRRQVDAGRLPRVARDDEGTDFPRLRRAGSRVSGAEHSAPDFVVLVLDATSRRLFHRRFPLTVRVLEKARGNAAGPHVHEFFRHSGAGVFSWPNFSTLLSGSRCRPDDCCGDVKATLFDLFRRLGYRTAALSGMCEPLGKLVGEYIFDVDHELVAPFCTHPYLSVGATSSHSPWRGPYSHVSPLCVGANTSATVMLDFVRRLRRSCELTEQPLFALATLSTAMNFRLPCCKTWTLSWQSSCTSSLTRVRQKLFSLRITAHTGRFHTR